MREKGCVLGLCLVVLVACKLGEEEKAAAGAECSRDSECRSDLLCEGAMCVPKAVAERARSANSGAKADRATATPVACASPPPPTTSAVAQVEGPIPLIPTERSNPPQGSEWDQGKAVNTQHPASQPDKCSMHILREWLQVTCREDYRGYEKMENFGVKNADYYERIDPGRVLSFVLRLKKGKTQAIRFCGPGRRASLFVNWPAAADRPTHVALGKGPACDGSEWGTTRSVHKVPLRKSPKP